MTGRLENGNGKWKYSDKTWTMTSEFGLYKAERTKQMEEILNFQVPAEG